ncbi:MAG: 3'-5' exonuclease [Flavobacteriales bacterium]|nr:3'-5' exonuclease [Flavobacteriales bacterium]
MLLNLDLTKILFLDIETVPQFADYMQLDETTATLWDDKAGKLSKQEQTGEEMYERAGIYAEFGKIICISVGVFNLREGGKREFRLRSFYGDDEKLLLNEFAAMLNNHFSRPDNLLCGHNGKEFDFPFLARRMIINRIPIPKILNMVGKKPWEVQHLDTMEMWKFGDWKSYTSLKLLAHVLDVPTPKTDIEGKDVARVYYEENDLERIEQYCKRDTLAVAQLLLRFRGEDILNEDQIVDT